MPKKATEAQRRRVVKLLAVLRDPSPSAAEKRNAAAALASLYEKHPELATLRLAPDEPPDPPPVPEPPAARNLWTPEFLERVGRAGLRAAERQGLVSKPTASVLGEVLDEVVKELRPR